MNRVPFLNPFKLAPLLPALTAGFVSGILATIFQISCAALIFSGDLSPFLAQGIGLALLGGAVGAFIVALTSSFPVAVASSQNGPAAILALASASLAAVLAQQRSASPFVTVVGALTLTTLLTGVIFLDSASSAWADSCVSSRIP